MQRKETEVFLIRCFLCDSRIDALKEGKNTVETEIVNKEC